MKIWPRHFALIAFLAISSPAGMYEILAQDASFPNPDAYEEIEPEREKVMVSTSPGEADPTVNKAQPTISKESSSTSKTTFPRQNSLPAQTPKPSAKQSTQEDDAMLSFNFLYYLFEKYKMQDIVDQ